MNSHTIATALQALLYRSNGDAFLILEHKASGKYVQFAGCSNEPLLAVNTGWLREWGYSVAWAGSGRS